ncbi:pilin [Nucisporomicrobium flavum]|uniref:pilin n=1 Tax=Nucisporomicrobium flavum TaxID=2785915 RepID=UPI003C2EFB3F
MNRHPLHHPPSTPRRPVCDWRGRRLTSTVRLLTTATAVTAVAVLTCTDTAQAAPADPHMVVLAAPPTSVAQVIDNIRLWLMGILAAWATLCLTVGFLRYTSGEPGEVERGKLGLRSAAIGYAGALLTPLILRIVGSWVS